MRKLILTLLVAIFLSGCGADVPKELTLFDFETDSELDRMHWKCFTMFALSEEHATHGQKSLKMELYPSEWPGWTPKIAKTDWRGFQALGFDLYNPADENLKVTLRIDDREDYPDYPDRYNQAFLLAPGKNRIEVELEELITSGTQRRLNLDNIYRVLLFMHRPEGVVTLYLDHVRLFGIEGKKI